MEKYNITAENLYNWDKKDFLISYASATQQIIFLEIFKSERIQYISEDSNKEFISLLAYISANSTALPLILIYKDNSFSLQDTWLKN